MKVNCSTRNIVFFIRVLSFNFFNFKIALRRKVVLSTTDVWKAEKPIPLQDKYQDTYSFVAKLTFEFRVMPALRLSSRSSRF